MNTTKRNSLYVLFKIQSEQMYIKSIVFSLEQCDSILPPASGDVVASSDGLTTHVKFSCVTMYDMNGSNTSMCLSDGTWTNAAPTCSK